MCHAGKTLTTTAVVKALVRAIARETPTAQQVVALSLNCAELGGAKVIFSHSTVLLAIANPAKVACMLWQGSITRDSVKSLYIC